MRFWHHIACHPFLMCSLLVHRFTGSPWFTHHPQGIGPYCFATVCLSLIRSLARWRGTSRGEHLGLAAKYGHFAEDILVIFTLEIMEYQQCKGDVRIDLISSGCFRRRVVEWYKAPQLSGVRCYGDSAMNSIGNNFGNWRTHRIRICMPYMVTFTIDIPQMLAYIPYMDPMGNTEHDRTQVISEYDDRAPCFV